MATRDEILATMTAQEPRRIFRTMQLGGNTKQLEAMEDAGLISSESRYGGRLRQRNWFLSEAQWDRRLADLKHTKAHARADD